MAKKVYSEEQRLKRNAYTREYLRAKRKSNPEYFKENKKRFYAKYPEANMLQAMKSRYGVTEEQYRALLEACENKCPVCGEAFKKERREPCVDHCHATGLVRGLLCNNCNQAEGRLKTPEAALRLYHYMMKNQLFYGGGN